LILRSLEQAQGDPEVFKQETKYMRETCMSMHDYFTEDLSN